jgi:hypothetical protein
VVVINSAATAISNQKKGLTLSNGFLVVVDSDTGTNAEFKYSTDSGVTWTDYAADIAGWADGSIASYVDSGGIERIVAVWKQSGVGGGRTDGRLYAIVGTFNAGRTTITWGSAVNIVNNDNIRFYPDVVAHAEGTGGQLHVAYASLSGTLSRGDLVGHPINSSGVIGAENYGIASTDYATSSLTYPSLEINPSTKDLYMAWSAGAAGVGKGIRFRKITYSAGTWTGGTEREIDNTVYVASSGYNLQCRYYASVSEVYIGGNVTTNGSLQKVMLYRRDAADTTTTTHTLDANASTSQQGSAGGTFAIDSNTGDAYFFGTHYPTWNDIHYTKWTRSGTSYGTAVRTDEPGNNANAFTFVWFSGSTLRWVYTAGNNSPYQIKYDQLTLNVAPSIPTNLARISDATDTTPLFSADISDPNTGQQIKARFEIQTLAGAAVGTVDSAFRSGAGNVTAEYSSALAVGQYKVRAQTIDDLGLVSAQTAFVNFDVTQTVTKDETLKWDVRQYVFKDVSLLWDVLTNNSKELTLLWNVYQSVAPKDITLLWSVEPVWVDVPYETVSPTWQEVAP